jgi:exosortase
VFIAFLIPLPGALVDWLTLPLKESVSAVVDEVLYRAGYPVARSGVVLTIGSYQMLIADACAGLNSMYTLSALCLFYIYLRQYSSRTRNGLLLLAVLPIAFLANIARVLALLLITYYFGDAAGRSFLHDFAGFAELIVALFALFMIDAAVGRIATDGLH